VVSSEAKILSFRFSGMVLFRVKHTIRPMDGPNPATNGLWNCGVRFTIRDMRPKGTGKPVIGLVGGVGSGKSTVAAELGRLGCAVIDADRIAHAMLTRDDVRQEVRRRWGSDAFDPDGQVDRDALGAIAFSDPASLARLSAILHPLIRQAGQEQLARCLARAEAPAVVIDAPLLIEAGWDTLCTHLVFVESSPVDRARRVRLERGWDKAKWQVRESSQKTLDTKAGMCDYILSNTSSVSHLLDQIHGLLEKIVHASD